MIAAAGRVTETPLYAFSSHTFTNASATGKTGPTLGACRAAYSSTTWANNTSYFNMFTQGIQRWTAPSTGKYRILAVGACGGIPYTSTLRTGYGARVQADFELLQSDILNIVVGHRGFPTAVNQYGSAYNGGGGGGSFVYLDGATWPLIVAGGGAGGAFDGVVGRPNAGILSNGTPGIHIRNEGTLAVSGLVTGQALGDGGLNLAPTNYRAGAGGGWSGNGNGGHSLCTGFTVVSGKGKPSNFVGGQGSNAQTYATFNHSQQGGFGGGGGGTGRCGSCQAGGGGGYTGGGHSGSTDTTPTKETCAGGGSYIFPSGTATSLSLNASLVYGYVTITKV